MFSVKEHGHHLQLQPLTVPRSHHHSAPISNPHAMFHRRTRISTTARVSLFSLRQRPLPHQRRTPLTLLLNNIHHSPYTSIQVRPCIQLIILNLPTCVQCQLKSVLGRPSPPQVVQPSRIKIYLVSMQINMAQSVIAPIVSTMIAVNLIVLNKDLGVVSRILFNMATVSPIVLGVGSR